MKEKVVKCVYNFTAGAETDLEIKPGDLIRVTKVINDDWYEGESNGKRGQFPSAFVEQCDDVFDLVVAIKTFTSDQEGDLCFNEGDFIVVTEILDENWMQGYIEGGSLGMFPRSFVKEVSSSMEVTSVSSTPNEKLSENTVSNESNEEAESGPKWVNVLENFNAMDSNELDLFAGSKIQYLCDVDDFWCKGISEGGKEGIFPRNFVDLPEIQQNIFEKANKENVELDKSSSPVSVEDSPNTSTNKETEIEEIEKEMKSIGRLVALFDFHTGEKGDLQFDSGEEIFLLEKINENWMKGQLADRIGIFPSSYVDVKEMYPTNDSSGVKKTVSQEINNNENCNDKSTENKKDIKKSNEDNNNSLYPRNGNDRDTNKNLSADTTYENVSPSPRISSKPTAILNKPAKPQRPKLPESKKTVDEMNPFSYQFKTKSQPLVIIPQKYFKPGSSNIILLKNWKNAIS